MEHRGARLGAAIGACSACAGIALGAFGAHGLRNALPPEMMSVFETGVRYQMYHAGGIMLAGIAAATGTASTRWGFRSCLCFAAGTLLFSGSLYALAITGIRWFGAVTPVGGLLFLAGWIFLALAFARGADA
jgi:uncharacterized membrane protein YgdD (TMEM256/DUF423 family)